MKTLEIIGYKRANLGKSDAKGLREEGNVPGVLYGGEEQIHFYVPMIQFREIVYTPNVHFINLNIEGRIFECILQDIQFHPVSEIILHADFLQLFEGKSVRMDIPVKLTGISPGVTQGGTVVHKRRTLSLRALPKDMPESIEVDITGLDFHKSIKVGEVEEKDFEILDPDQASIVVVEVPRALKVAEEEALAAEEAAEQLVEEGAEGEGAADAEAKPAAEGESDKPDEDAGSGNTKES